MSFSFRIKTYVFSVIAVLMGFPVFGVQGTFTVGNLVVPLLVVVLAVTNPRYRSFHKWSIVGALFLVLLAFLDYINGVEAYEIAKALLRNSLLVLLPVISYELCLRYGAYKILLWLSLLGSSTYTYYLLGGGLYELDLSLLTKWRSGVSVGLLVFLILYRLLKQRHLLALALVSLGVAYQVMFSFRSAGFTFILSGLFILIVPIFRRIPIALQGMVGVLFLVISGTFYLNYSTDITKESSKWLLQVNSTSLRLEGMGNAVVDISKSPIKGYGYLMKETAVLTDFGYRETYVHSYLLQMPLEYGLLGFFVTVLFLIGLVSLFKVYNKYRYGSISLSSLILITPFVVLGFYHCVFSLFSARGWEFGIILGVVYYLSRVPTNESYHKPF